MNNTATPDSQALHSDRTAAHPISALFLQRWSPRSFDPISMPESDLLTILEAARWAPSAFNIQPWRFIYTLRGKANWKDWLELLDPFNASWASNAAALVFLVSDTLTSAYKGNSAKPSRTHSFDAGAAWAHLALQATASGYQAHAMAGIHFEAVQQQLAVPDHYRVEIAAAIGRQAPPSRLPQALREREFPSSRLPLQQIAFRDVFAASANALESADGGSEQ